MSARRLLLELRPTAEAVFTARAATEGAHSTLDAPTGAALMGWVASRCYAAMGDTAQVVFHSGKVRFSDAVRIWKDKPVFRNPATLLVPKHGQGVPALGQAAYRQIEANEAKQPQPLKNVWMTLSGKAAPCPNRRRRLRTAVDGSSRSAENGKLFPVDALGSRDVVYQAVIECDADVLTDDIWNLVVEAFRGPVRLGRGKRSGYGGQYNCTIAPPQQESPWPKPEANAAGDLLCFWLLSDALITDSWGAPCVPTASDFGLSSHEWLYEGEQSAISMRRVWPWNGVLDSRDIELPLIEAGSVVAFRWIGDGEPNFALKPLIGAGHERGYGRYTLIPGDFCYSPLPTEQVTAAQPGDSVEEPPSDLARWAMGRSAERAAIDDPEWTKSMIKEGRDYLNRMQGGHPAPAQWGELGTLVDAWISNATDFETKLASSLKHPSWDAAYSGLRGWVTRTLFKPPEAPTTRSARASSVHKVIKSLRTFQPEDAR